MTMLLRQHSSMCLLVSIGPSAPAGANILLLVPSRPRSLWDLMWQSDPFRPSFRLAASLPAAARSSPHALVDLVLRQRPVPLGYLGGVRGWISDSGDTVRSRPNRR